MGAWWLAPQDQPIEPESSSPRPSASAIAENSRPIFRHSVIPGGVRDNAELAERLKSDAAAAAHYRGVAVEKLQPRRLKKAAAAYVSYRREGTIYWTSRPVELPAGELVLEGGGETVRARCGNRISKTLRLPIAKREPPLEELDIPELVAGSGPPVPPNQYWPDLSWPGAPAAGLEKLAMVTSPQPGVESIAAYAGLAGLVSGPILGSVPGTGAGSGAAGGVGGGSFVPPPEDGVGSSVDPGAAGPVDGPPSSGGSGGNSGGGSDDGAGNSAPAGGSGSGEANPAGGPPGIADSSKAGGSSLPSEGTDTKRPGILDPPPAKLTLLDPPVLLMPPNDEPPGTPPDNPPPGAPPRLDPPGEPTDPIAEVPEPATIGLAAAALAAVALFRRR